MIMCVLLCYPVSIRIYYQQGGLFLVFLLRCFFLDPEIEIDVDKANKEYFEKSDVS